MEKIETFSQPILKLRNHFTAILKPKGKKKHKKEDRIPFLKLGDRFHSEEEDFVEEGDFRSPFCSREMGVQRCEVALVCQGGCGCNISAHGVRAHLQTAITSSFQLQIDHRLKLWTPDFPIFETAYGMHNLSSKKCSKNVSNSCQNGGASDTFPFMGGSVAMKHPSKWHLGCETVDLQAWKIRSHFAAAKRVYLAVKWHSCAKGPLRSCENFCRGR
uniref:Uncharacterized protein n=1 Tax=Vitis vinifera TaxID=29760 RepID=A5B2B9_VITVI|nr:hypothetical protein VITISV_016910 [Vitis vinifera]